MWYILDFAASIVLVDEVQVVVSAAAASSCAALGLCWVLIATNLDPRGCLTWVSTRSSVVSSEAQSP